MVYADALVTASAAAGPLDPSEYGVIESSHHIVLAACVAVWAAAWARARHIGGPGESRVGPSAGLAVMALLAPRREVGWLPIYGLGEAHRLVEVVSAVVGGLLLIAIVWHRLAAPGTRRDRIIGFLTSAALSLVAAGGLLLILADGFKTYAFLPGGKLMEEAVELYERLAFLMGALLIYAEAVTLRRDGGVHP